MEVMVASALMLVVLAAAYGSGMAAAQLQFRGRGYEGPDRGTSAMARW